MIKGKPTYKRIMGIDASSNSFAYSVYVDGKLSMWGEVEFVGKTLFERLHDAQQKLSSMQNVFDVDLIVFESAVFVRNKKTVVSLAYVFGAVVSALMKRGDPADVRDISPLVWQNAIGNKPLSKAEKEKIQKATLGKSTSWYTNKYREERKDRTRQWVKQQYGLDIESDNVTDAIAIGHVAAVLGK